MSITLDQARALHAIVELGTFQKAAESLGKGHSAVMYLIKGLEQVTGLVVLDRSGYRNRLTPEGEVVHKYCIRLIETSKEMSKACDRLKGGWEPRVSLVYDGVIDFNWIGDVLLQLSSDEIPTEIKISTAYLDEVEQRFSNDEVDMMLTILPNQQKSPSLKLKPLNIFLVAHKDHYLGLQKKKIPLADLNSRTYIAVRGSTGSLGLSTEQMEISSLFWVNDFHTKKQAILKGLGYGWLPEYMIQDELKNKELKILNTEISNHHKLYPRLYHKRSELLGNGAKAILNAFKQAHLA